MKVKIIRIESKSADTFFIVLLILFLLEPLTTKNSNPEISPFISFHQAQWGSRPDFGLYRKIVLVYNKNLLAP
jgi:hypothetical protein